MTKGAWTSTAVESTILAADSSRRQVAIQHTGGDAAYLGFGETAEVGKGIRVNIDAPYLQITDARAQMAIHMICDTGQTATGGYQTT
jgi:hypothetical protein